MRYLMLWALITLAVSGVSACADDSSANTPSPTRSEENTSAASKAPPSFARMDTPEGEAMIELVLDKRSIGAGERLAVRLVNGGEVPLMTGLAIRDERWDSSRWVEVKREGVWAWPSVGLTLGPGQGTEAQTWPFGGVSEPEPGRYRLTKSARYEGGDGEHDSELVARAIFVVTAE